jgi:hypothetical protein
MVPACRSEGWRIESWCLLTSFLPVLRGAYKCFNLMLFSLNLQSIVEVAKSTFLMSTCTLISQKRDVAGKPLDGTVQLPFNTWY